VPTYRYTTAPVAGVAYTSVDLSAATLDDGSPDEVFNALSSTLGVTSSIVLDVGNPGMPDAGMDPLRFHWEVTDALDQGAYEALHLRFICSTATHSSQAYTAWVAAHATSAIANGYGWYGGANINTGVARTAKLGSTPTSSATGGTFSTGGTFGVLISWDEDDPMMVSAHARGGTTTRGQSEVGTLSAWQPGGALHASFGIGSTASRTGLALAGVRLDWALIPRKT